MNHTSSLRWRIALLIAAAIAISYFDRQTLPVAIKSIQLDIPISNTQFSQLQAAFLTAYAAGSWWTCSAHAWASC
jgi:ACS family hexuronate transporter-like MFS transporter